MRTITHFFSENYTELIEFIKSADFSKAIMIGFAVAIPILLGIQFEHLDIGLALCFGAFWSSPSDVSGSYRHKKFGILLSAVLVTIVSFIGGYLHYGNWLTLPILGILSFAIAFISVFGFRASLISFSGLLALLLSFAHDPQRIEIYQYALLTGIGGLWYLALAMLWYRINPKARTEEILSNTYRLTAEFLKVRGKLVSPQKDRKKLQATLRSLQSELTAQHANLREVLIVSRKNSGLSIYKGKRMLVFAQLVEMLETAIANPVKYDKTDALFNKHPKFIKSFQHLIFEMSHQLIVIAEAENDIRKLPKNNTLNECFEKLKEDIASFRSQAEIEDYEGFVILQNLLGYQEKQFRKLKKIKWLLGDPDMSTVEFIDKEISKQFIPRMAYDPRLLVQNFSFRSSIFKHSLRLAVTLMIGYALGSLREFQNPYWILLTIIVILRPSYGLTKNRSKDRIIGTLIGGAIATGMIFLIQNPYAYGVMGVVSLVIAISMMQKNFKASATFITLTVIFIYAISQPDVLTVIQYRVLDTILGAGLSFIAMLWFWPTWGFLEIRQDIENSIKANKDFLGQITNFYQLKGKVPTSYKVSRKDAFLETSNLDSAFQRMAQEPRSKQKNLDKIYEMVELNHTFLASLASLSTFLQHHLTSEASEMFKTATAKIDENLSLVLRSLSTGKPDRSFLINEDESFFEQQQLSFQSHNNELNFSEEMKQDPDFQETYLIWEQLRWLYSLSVNMLKLTASLKLD